MAKGSEKFQWNLFPGIPRECWQCKRGPLKIKDVGEHRTHYPSRKTEFLCVDCQRENTEAAMHKNRVSLGLADA